MANFKKYGFTDKAEAKTYIDALTVTDEDGNEITHNNAIVECGFIVVTPGEYDEEGNETTPPILSDKYIVDVLWNDKKDKDWKDFRYKLNGVKNYHTFAGVSYSDDTV